MRLCDQRFELPRQKVGVGPIKPKNDEYAAVVADVHAPRPLLATAPDALGSLRTGDCVALRSLRT